MLPPILGRVIHREIGVVAVAVVVRAYRDYHEVYLDFLSIGSNH